MEKIYLDHNATTPVHPEVLEAMLPVLRENFGNPSSIHSFGRSVSLNAEKAKILSMHSLSHYDKVRRTISVQIYK